MQHGELTNNITAAVAEIDRLDGEAKRCNAAIAAGEQHANALAALRQRRVDETALAFVERREASVAAIDKEIAAAEKLHGASIAQAAAARDGLQIIEQRIAELRGELSAARGNLTVLVQADLEKRLGAARQRFVDAVNDLREPLAEYAAIAQMIGDVRGTPGSSGSIMPGLITRALLDKGLVVPRETDVMTPGWLHYIQDDARDKHADLIAEIRGTGLDL